MVMDDQGIFMRDGAGRTREAPADPRTQIASSALLHVMRFDLKSLANHFSIYAAGSPDTWHFVFDPRDQAVAKTVSRIFVSGTDDEVRRIQMRKSALQRVEIEIGSVEQGAKFTEADLKKFFR